MNRELGTKQLMYSLLEDLAKQGLPVVFKGAILLKQIIDNETELTTNRMTKDIDLNWIEQGIATESIKGEIQKALDNISGSEYVVEIVREFKPGRSAGFIVKDKDMQKLFSIDVSNKPNPHNTQYKTDGGVVYTGSSKEKIYVDKISAISSPKIIRRTKYIYDLYLMSYLGNLKLSRIMEIMENEGGNLGDFKEFLERGDDLRHAYKRWKVFMINLNSRKYTEELEICACHF